MRHDVLAAQIAFPQEPITPDPVVRRVREVLDVRLKQWPARELVR